ncbi:dicarboxylate/amino acid:cation symporter [Caloramator sp. E03]|uniref:dicarboxylate/amino acid:cation symporter n=1 Tax=Caloramator sp. E03 TaxID=2576307 RepID=UPI0011100938|nr:dicarboxylate/amino acid:cation symporter [Caloramator sp. E03]QCX33427.1 dicarboxylate/amino acid:cation symporter [Caloramator sp. E03]
MSSSYISLVFSIIILFFLYFLKTKKISFGIRVLIAMFLGIVIGAFFKKNALIIEPVGKIFVGLIKMIVIPLIITSIISSITSLNSTNQIKKIGLKTIMLLLFTTAIATAIGILVALPFNLGTGLKFVQDSSFKAREIPTFSKVLTDMIPSNPIAAMADGKTIPVIIFSIIISIAIIIEEDKNPIYVKPVKDFINAFAKIMFRITKIIIKLAPYGVFSLMASISAAYGLSTLIPLGKFIIAVYLACLLQIVIVHGGLVAFVVKINPLRFFKSIYPAQLVAFTTQSSYGTLPITIKSLTGRTKISEQIASFAAPIGATIGMNACGGLYPAIAAIFVANVFNIPLNINDYLLLIATTTFASIGIAGVPGTASIATTVVLSVLGLPIEGLAMLLGIDVIIDMIRTATNVTGASVTALIVANSENQFDREAFNKDIDELELNTV